MPRARSPARRRRWAGPGPIAVKAGRDNVVSAVLSAFTARKKVLGSALETVRFLDVDREGLSQFFRAKDPHGGVAVMAATILGDVGVLS